MPQIVQCAFSERRTCRTPCTLGPDLTRGRDRTSIAKLLTDQRSNQTVLTFLATTDVGPMSGPPTTDEDEDAASDASEWEAREQEERAWERKRKRRG